MNRCAFYLPELGESELGSPDLTLATEAVSTDQLEPAIKEQDSWLAGLVRRVTSKRRADKKGQTTELSYLLVDQLLSLERSSRILGCLLVCRRG